MSFIIPLESKDLDFDEIMHDFDTDNSPCRILKDCDFKQTSLSLM